MKKTTKNKTKKDKSKIQKTDQSWYLFDAKGQILGRLATKIAKVLMGKHKVTWQPHQDMGDNVIVTNASKILVTGRKEENKVYYRYSGYPGGLKKETLGSLRERKPENIIHHAVAGMLPKNRLGRAMIKKLYIYPGEEHPYEAQKPIKWEG